MTAESVARHLINSIEEYFAFLKVFGFRILADSIKVSPTLVQLEIVASRIAFMLSVDIRDGSMSCYITHAIQGRAAQMGGEYNFERLSSYMRRKKMIWKDRVPSELNFVPSDLAQRITMSVRIYAIMIRAAAEHSKGDVNELTF
jgi:hypothetical protein